MSTYNHYFRLPPNLRKLASHMTGKKIFTPMYNGPSDELQAWLDSNFDQGSWQTGQTYIAFREEADAVVFKLTWLT